MPLFIKYNILRKLFVIKNKKRYFRKVKLSTFLPSKKEGLLKINKNIDLIFINSEKNAFTNYFLQVSNTNEVTKLTVKQQYFTKSLINIYLKKRAFLNEIDRKIQYFYFLYNLISLYSVYLNNLIKNEIFSFDNFFFNTPYAYTIEKLFYTSNFGLTVINTQTYDISSHI